MNQIIVKSSFNITGFKTTTNNQNELNNTSNISKLWDNYFNSKLFHTNNIAYGVYYNYKNRHFNDYDILVGIEETKNENFDNVIIQSGKYMVFKKEGNIPQIVVELWQEIWKFFDKSDIKRAYNTDFEKYIGKDKIEIYISIL